MNLIRVDSSCWILDALERAHRQEKFVGGLYHAYEKALHFALLTELYRSDVWGAKAERAYETAARAKCDLVIPLDTKQALWLEAKLMWFAGNNRFPYWTAAKFFETPVEDWKRLSEATARGDERAVLVLVGWDDTKGSREHAAAWADARLADLSPKPPRRRALRPFPFTDDGAQHQLEGALLLWSSVEGHG